MTNNRLIEQYFDKEQTLLNVIYDKWPVGQEVRDVNQNTLAPELGSSTHKAMRHFEELGIFSKVLEYGTPVTGMGRHYHYTLLMQRDEAHATLANSVAERRAETEQRHDKGNKAGADKRRGRKLSARKVNAVGGERIADTPLDVVAIATNDKEEVRAIAGEEPLGTLATRLREASKAARVPDESAALVEAARQYQGRSGALAAKVAELEAVAKDLGMTIDTTQLMGAVSFEPDPVLETVALTLPYIRSLESRNEALGVTIAEQREKLKGFDELRIQNRRLHEQNQRLVARVGTTTVAHA